MPPTQGPRESGWPGDTVAYTPDVQPLPLDLLRNRATQPFAGLITALQGLGRATQHAVLKVSQLAGILR